MMNRQNILTAAGIALSLAIVLGGWALTNMLINMKSDALLSVSGVTWINLPLARPADTADPSAADNTQTHPGTSTTTPGYAAISGLPNRALPIITEHDIVSILRLQDSPGREMPHEPTIDQISMEEAILIGEAALTMLDINGIIPEDLFVIDRTKTTAYLAQHMPPEASHRFTAPIYSYWALAFKGEGMDGGSVSMRINASTGRVLEIDLQLERYPYDTAAIGIDVAERILANFIFDMGIGSDAGIKVSYNATSSPPSIVASQEFAGGAFYAVVNVNGRQRPEEPSKIILMGIHAYLSTQSP